MKSKTLLTISAVYMGLIGFGYLLFPTSMMDGIDPNASVSLAGEIRVVASTFLGIALMNWWARSSGPSRARDAIFLGNAVGAGLAGVLDLFEVLGGGPAYGAAFVIINLFLSMAFFWIGWEDRSAKTRLGMNQPQSA